MEGGHQNGSNWYRCQYVSARGIAAADAAEHARTLGAKEDRLLDAAVNFLGRRLFGPERVQMNLTGRSTGRRFASRNTTIRTILSSSSPCSESKNSRPSVRRSNAACQNSNRPRSPRRRGRPTPRHSSTRSPTCAPPSERRGLRTCKRFSQPRLHGDLRQGSEQGDANGAAHVRTRLLRRKGTRISAQTAEGGTNPGRGYLP